MAELPNCRVWYSCDCETGTPPVVSPRVRLAYLSIASDDLPPSNAGLVFRIRRLRSQEATHLNSVRVCPAEDGMHRTQKVTCERCQLCWQPLADASVQQMSLPLLSGSSLPKTLPEEGA